MFSEYKNFLSQFKKNGYIFKFFHQKISKRGNIVLRHDIDFDTKYALNIAKVEKKLNIKSTFFFLIKSESYNILNPEEIKRIKEISSMGHEISVHFDPSIYKRNKILEGLKSEIKIFEYLFNNKIRIISFHRPSKKFINLNKKIIGVNHTYQDLYKKKIKYFADSRNIFSYGNPLKSIEFKNKLSLQLLLHPIWWQKKFSDNINLKIKKFITKKNYDLKLNLKKNLNKSKLNFK
jgi:hypothetical protein